MRHLYRGDETWCEYGGPLHTQEQIVEDPREADCCVCLREAASFGAAAAMRCAAVENADSELAQERDHALAQLDKIERALHAVGYFMCGGCDRITSNESAGMLVPVRLCHECVP